MKLNIERYLFNSREEWRRWLEENHNTASETWLVYYKVHTGKLSIRYEEAVEAALCFGWIDSKVKKIDDEKYMQRYTPRKDDSNWAKSNKQRVKLLTEKGKMTPAGLEKVSIAKYNGAWYRLDDIEGEIVLPDDLEVTLSANPKAKENFDKFSPSQKRQYLWWLKSARRSETRANRLAEIVERAEKNIKPG
jgi:uncharacterized protein YdeI (YjbR/CyaY-like superfamily)